MLTKNLARYVAVLFAALCGLALLLTPLGTAHAAGLPVDEFKAKTPGIPDSTIQTISDFDLNKAKVVGGGTKVADPVATGATAVTSPDGNFKLIQGTRMFVEYVNKAAITDLNGGYQKLPGSITLQWDDAAVDKTTGEKLDAQISISDLNLRVADFENKVKNIDREMVDSSRIVLMVNEGGWDSSFEKDMHAPGATSPEQWYKEIGFSNLALKTTSLTHKIFTNWANYTVNFINKDGTENKGRINVACTDIDAAGVHRRADGLWIYGNYERTDRAQEHIKLLTPGDSLHVTSDSALWTDGLNPHREVWSNTKERAWADTKAWAVMNLRSGSTFEIGNAGGYMGFFLGIDTPFSKITVTKKGNEQEAGATLPTGTNVKFTYEVKNVGIARVDKIAVTDSKGVKVTCPKTTLEMNESMTCTGRGVVK